MLPWSLLLASATGSWGSSLYMAGLCRGHTCSDAKFPILDWAPHIKECVCNAHPCWNDQGVVHKCPGDRKEDKYLSFYYDDKGALHCGCSPEPHYGTIHLSKKVCPGHHCCLVRTKVLQNILSLTLMKRRSNVSADTILAGMTTAWRTVVQIPNFPYCATAKIRRLQAR
mmetsp:Transcript_68681/g.108179  ORF Transcript_68681/g.108179 Transcript_68681/m.108179 type:complete len:169 (+) Transcript_68681:44-550(+)